MRLSESHYNLLRQLVELPPNKRVRTGSVPQEFIDLKDAGLADIIPIGALDLLTATKPPPPLRLMQFRLFEIATAIS
jgi:hypothetical protein